MNLNPPYPPNIISQGCTLRKRHRSSGRLQPHQHLLYDNANPINADPGVVVGGATNLVGASTIHSGSPPSPVATFHRHCQPCRAVATVGTVAFGPERTQGGVAVVATIHAVSHHHHHHHHQGIGTRATSSPSVLFKKQIVGTSSRKGQRNFFRAGHRGKGHRRVGLCGTGSVTVCQH